MDNVAESAVIAIIVHFVAPAASEFGLLAADLACQSLSLHVL